LVELDLVPVFTLALGTFLLALGFISAAGLRPTAQSERAMVELELLQKSLLLKVEEVFILVLRDSRLLLRVALTVTRRYVLLLMLRESGIAVADFQLGALQRLFIEVLISGALLPEDGVLDLSEGHLVDLRDALACFEALVQLLVEELHLIFVGSHYLGLD